MNNLFSAYDWMKQQDLPAEGRMKTLSVPVEHTQEIVECLIAYGYIVYAGCNDSNIIVKKPAFNIPEWFDRQAMPEKGEMRAYYDLPVEKIADIAEYAYEMGYAVFIGLSQTSIVLHNVD
jgi:hypothetical protein|nr:MAG TPA: hypothetical protein [Caudoviricetes sp.]